MVGPPDVMVAGGLQRVKPRIAAPSRISVPYVNVTDIAV